MARATKILNKYEIKLLALSDRDINYDNFYKEELIAFCKCLKEEYKNQKEVIDRANKKLNNFIDCCKAEKLESGSDYIHHQYWDMFERFNKQIKDILKEVE